jgi:hypothetical protein
MFRQLRLSYYEAPSLTEGLVCNLLVQLLLGFASAFTLRPESHRTRDHNILSHLRLPQPVGPGPPICVPREEGAQLYPRALGSLFIASYDPQGYGGLIQTRLDTGLWYSKISHITADSLSKYQATHHLGPAINFLSHPRKLSSDICCFLF